MHFNIKYPQQFAHTRPHHFREYSICGKKVPGFIVGMWMGKYVKGAISIKHPIAKITAALICVVIVEQIVPLNIPIAWACVIHIIFLVAITCQYVGDTVRSMLKFMGGISLESYLFNVTLPFFIPNLS